MAFQEAHSFVVNNLIAVDNGFGSHSEVMKSRMDSHMKSLMDAGCLAASHNSEERAYPPKCHPNTRKKIIEEIMGWIDSNDQDKRIMWLNASAGAGKSAIAQTIAEICSKENKLLSSFFFSRTSTLSGRNDGNKLIPTIAYHLAIASPEARALVTSALMRDPGIFHLSMEEQLNRLVIEPIQHLKSFPFLIVIDGLDECQELKLQSRIISSITMALKHVKVFIASRPELTIRRSFDSISKHSRSLRKELQVDITARSDIELYVNNEFNQIKMTHILKDDLCNESNWPTEHHVANIVTMSSGHFIYAATVMTYISGESRDPRESLEDITESKWDRSCQENPFANLDALYINILETASSKPNGQLVMVLSILYALTFLNQSNAFATSVLQLVNLAEFLDVKVSGLKIQLAHLCSLLYVPQLRSDKVTPCEDPHEITLHHISMKDFLSDKSRSGKFFLDSKDGHAYIAQCCISVLLKMAKHPVADVEDGKDGYEDMTWNISSPIYYPFCISASQRYALDNYFFHIFHSQFGVHSTHPLYETSTYNAELVITTMLLNMPGYQILESLQYIFDFDFLSENFSEPKHENLKSLCTCICNALDSFALKYVHYEEAIFDSIDDLMRYQSREDRPMIMFQNIWAAALMGSPTRGRHLYLNITKVQHLLQTTLEEEHLDDILTLLEYYIRRFNLFDDFQNYILCSLTKGKPSDMNLPSGNVDSIQLGLTACISSSLKSLLCDFLTVYYSPLEICSATNKTICIENGRYLVPNEDCDIAKLESIEICHRSTNSINHIAEQPYLNLDELYMDILSMASLKINGGYEAMLPLLHALLFVDSTHDILKSTEDLAEFLELDESELTLQLEQLKLLVDVDTSAHAIAFGHKSVKTFLLDNIKSGEFSIDPVNGHIALGNRCLAIILHIIKFDFTFYQLKKTSDRYALENLFLHMKSGHYCSTSINSFLGLPEKTVNSILTIMHKNLPATTMLKSLENLYIFDYWSEDFSVPVDERVRDVCDCVNNALDHIMLEDVSRKQSDWLLEFGVSELIDVILEYDNEKNGSSECQHYIQFHELWKAALMGSPKRGGQLFLSETQITSFLYTTITKSRFSTRLDQHDYILNPMKYYVLRFGKASNLELFMQARLPGDKFCFGNQESADASFNKYVRIALKEFIIDYIKHCNSKRDKSSDSSYHATVLRASQG